MRVIAAAVLTMVLVIDLHAENTRADRTAKFATIAGLSSRPGATGDELRVWSFSDDASRNFVIVLRRAPDGVKGEAIRWWPTRYAPDRRWVPPGWRCARHVVQPDFRLCRGAFERPPDWTGLLRELEREDVWTLPDGSQLPWSGPKDLAYHGADLIVEAHQAGGTRAYTYPTPEYRPGPDAVKAERILSRAFKFMDSLEKR